MKPARAARMRLAAAALAAAASASAAVAQTEPPAAAPRFQADEIAAGRAQYHRTCSQCHGLNMVNSGTTIYDLRRFPVDDPERFFTSVNQGKGNMPSFNGALAPEQVKLLWAYVGTRGGKEP